MIPFGEWLDLHMQHQGWTVGRISQLSGLDRPHIYRWLRCEVNPSLKSFIKVVSVMGLEPWEALLLMERADPENYHPEEI